MEGSSSRIVEGCDPLPTSLLLRFTRPLVAAACVEPNRKLTNKTNTSKQPCRFIIVEPVYMRLIFAVVYLDELQRPRSPGAATACSWSFTVCASTSKRSYQTLRRSARPGKIMNSWRWREKLTTSCSGNTIFRIG